MSNIHNNLDFKYWKSSFVRKLICYNLNCNYLKKSSRWNNTKCFRITSTLFDIGNMPPQDSNLICKVCDALSCIDYYNVKIPPFLVKVN
jgi:hypothetical protein